MLKFKFKLNKEQLNALYHLINHEVGIETGPTMQNKMYASVLLEIHKKLLLKWTYPNVKNSITFSSTQALVFWILFSPEDFTTFPFLFATINPILTAIHQQYV